MTSVFRSLFFVLIVLYVVGCARTMIPIHEIDASHTIGRPLTTEQINEGILEGARAAGWYAKVLSSGRILATYHIRVHTVHLEIFSTDAYYKLTYQSSNGLKMYCTEQDRLNNRNIDTSCPGGGVPLYVHGNFKKWVDSLNASIQNSLASM
jgi:hypothetical protein